MEKYKFYKTEENRWFIDVPDWQGDLDCLEMVAGADTLLDILSQGDNEIDVCFVLNSMPVHRYILIKSDEYDGFGGASYDLYDKEDYMFSVWLCPVTKFLFKEYPHYISIL